VALVFAFVIAAAAGLPAGGMTGPPPPAPRPVVEGARALPPTGDALRSSTTGLAAARLTASRTTPTTSAPVARTSAARSAPVAPAPPTAPPAAGPTYEGKNRVWIPSLGLNRAVDPFPCSRTKPPGNSIYRWGCAGKNNVYLLAHAATAFKPLHTAYVKGKLRKGMEVIYANGAGQVRTYKVTFWKVVSPVDAEWAYAAQPKPSMTLQTCVGDDNEYRLIVRLVAA